jgi:hypothetical protein
MYKEILIPSEFIILKLISYLQSLKQLKGLIIVPLHIKLARQSIICKQILIENHRILFVGSNGNDYKRDAGTAFFVNESKQSLH